MYIQLSADGVGFKPCYKWNTFNTDMAEWYANEIGCFKPCYKWNTFNTLEQKSVILKEE